MGNRMLAEALAMSVNKNEENKKDKEKQQKQKQEIQKQDDSESDDDMAMALAMSMSQAPASTSSTCSTLRTHGFADNSFSNIFFYSLYFTITKYYSKKEKQRPFIYFFDEISSKKSDETVYG